MSLIVPVESRMHQISPSQRDRYQHTVVVAPSTSPPHNGLHLADDDRRG